MCEPRHAFPNCASALAHVPKGHREFWSEAKSVRPDRLDACQPSTLTKVEQPSTADTGRSRAASHRVGRGAGKQSATPHAATVSNPPAAAHVTPRASGGDHPTDSEKPKRVADDEWRKLLRNGTPRTNGTCKFWNLFCGCNGSPSDFRPKVRWQCGGDREWTVRHYTPTLWTVGA